MTFRRLENWLEFRQKAGLLNQPWHISEYADAAYVTNATASADLQDYQRLENEKGWTRFVLYRDKNTRTKKAMWIAGVNPIDAVNVAASMVDDIYVKVSKTILKLIAMGKKQPSTAASILVVINTELSVIGDIGKEILHRDDVSAGVVFLEKLAYGK